MAAAAASTVATVLVVDDEEMIRTGLQRILAPAGYQVVLAASGQQALDALQLGRFDLVISDLKMPGLSGLEVLKAIKVLQPAIPVIIITGYAAVATAIAAMKGGAFDYLAKPFTPEELLAKVRQALAAAQAAPAAPEEPDLAAALGAGGFDRFIGVSPAMQKVYQRILQVAPTDSTVLICGESGTGKELVAQAIHRHSKRRDHPFVAVDCTSLSEQLLESELFGHVKGSFTGAIQTKPGLFKIADGGTLFLDEVANISLTTQAKLLRVLQERELTPIGATQPVPIDIRLVAASNQGLRDLVASGAFREDLFFRLNIIPVDLPPLREREGDLPLLIAHFLRQFAAETGKEFAGLAPDAAAALATYPYPGNVRELENLMERAVVLAEGTCITRRDLELPGAEPAPRTATAPTPALPTN